MRINRLKVVDFRSIDSCELVFPTDGISIIHGPNETGKSSIAEAIDLLLDFEDSSKHKYVKAVKPVHEDVGPSVEMEFSIGSQRLIYSKTWLKRAATRLTIDSDSSKSLTGRQAHDRVCELISQHIDYELFKALRIKQGEAIGQPRTRSATSLIEALDSAQSIQSNPQAEESLMEKIEREYRNYFTETGREIQSRINQREQLEDLIRSRYELLASYQSIEESGEEQKQATLRKVTLQQKFRVVLSDLENARQRKQTRESLEHKLGPLRLKRNEIGNSQTELEREKQDRVDLRARLEDAGKQESNLQEARSAMEKDKAEREDKLAAMVKELRNLDDQLRQKRSEAIRARDIGDFLRADFDKGQLLERLDKLNNITDRLSMARSTLGNSKIESLDRKRLEEVVIGRAGAAKALTYEQTEVTLESLRELEVQIAGSEQVLLPSRPFTARVDSQLEIKIPDILKVVVTFPGHDHVREAEYRQLENEYNNLVQEFDLDKDDPLSDYNNKSNAIRSARQEIDTCLEIQKDTLRDLRSADELNEKLDDALGKIKAFEGKYGDKLQIVENLQTIEAKYMALEDEVASLGNKRDDLNHSVQVSQEEIRTIIEDLIKNEVLLEERSKDHKRDQLRLDQLVAIKSDQSLVSELDTNTRELDKIHREIKSLEEQLSDPLLESIDEYLESCEGSKEKLDKEIREEEKRLEGLKVTLEHLGEQDIQNSIQNVEEKIKELEYSVFTQERKARAAQLLYETFRRHREQAKTNYLKPYKQALEATASKVFGGRCTIEVNSDLEIVSRTLNGSTVSFESLSTGAKEQLSIIVRFACAKLVCANSDEGVPIILDDILGHSDNERQKNISLAINALAQGAQVIIFTASPERFDYISNTTLLSIA